VASLLEHVRPALAANGDERAVETRLAEILAHGNGATRQRRVLERTSRLTDVVADLARVTAGMDT
jgi:carboxylate-amine ligase